MEGLLRRAGVSEYHLRAYLTPELARRGHRLAWAAAALLALGGGAAWVRAEPIAEWVRAEAARFRQLVAAPPVETHPASRRWDRAGGAALLAVSAAVALRALATFPIRGDEAAMYDSVASSWVPLWLVAGISSNNQPGHSALIWAGHFLWGDSVTGMRLFSLAFWGLSVAVAGRLHAALVGRRSLALVALAFALPAVLTMGILARGHVLTVFLVLLAALVAARSEGAGDAARAGVVAGLALWVVPTAVLALPILLALVAWRAGDRRDLAGRALGVLASIPVAALLYLPMHLGTGLGGIQTAQMASDEDLAAGIEWLVRMAGPDGLFHAWYVPPLLGLGALAAAVRPGSRWLLMLPLLVPLAAVVLDPGPVPHSLLFLAPLLLITWSAARRPWQRYVYGGLAGAAAVRLAVAGTSWLGPDIGGAADSAREAARLLATQPAAVVQTATHDSEYHVLRFYLRSHGWAGRLEVADSLTEPWIYEVNMPERIGPGLRPTGIEGLYRE